MTNAVQTIENIIKNRVWMLNQYFGCICKEEANSERDELLGMLVCLRNINDDENKQYALNWLEDGVEFGYYEFDTSNWIVIQ